MPSFCAQYGTSLASDARFCEECGTQYDPGVAFCEARRIQLEKGSPAPRQLFGWQRIFFSLVPIVRRSSWDWQDLLDVIPQGVKPVACLGLNRAFSALVSFSKKY